MASGIQTYLNNILNAIYGRDVRSSIHDAIELCYDDVTAGRTVAEAAAANVESAVSTATNAANAASAAAASASQAVEDANTAVTNANNAVSNASSILASATAATTSASNAATSASTAAQAANQAASAANEAATAANEAIETISEIDVDTAAALAAIAGANEAAGAANTAARSANNAATTATTAANNATQKASAADSAANACTVAAQIANSAATNANSARDSANTAANNANTARDDTIAATNEAIRATSAADNAASTANTAASNANAKITAMDAKMFDATAAINSANSAASAATVATTNANNARAAIEGLTVDYEDVGPNIPASAVLQTVNGHKNIHFLLRQGASGASFIIKGDAYATLAALQTAITNPEVGDQYNVGSSPPYNVYRWTGTTWENQGTIGTSLDQITAQDVEAIQNGREVENPSSKVLRVEGLTYLIQTLLTNLLANKVDKVTGKGLSKNDLTDELLYDLNYAYDYTNQFMYSKVDAIAGKGLSTNDLTDDLLAKIVLIGSDTLATTAQTIVAAINELNTNKAPKKTPTFTGTPKSTTPTSTDNSTRIATTAFVQGHVSSLSSRIDEVAAGGWAPLDSPAFTGTPAAPTQTKTDNSTAIATTAYVQSNLSDVSTALAAKASTNNAALTGSPTAPTPAASNNSTRIATTAYVQTALANKSNIYVSDVTVSSWTDQGSSPTYDGYQYRAALTTGNLSNVTSAMFAMVAFSTEQASSGNYAPVCETYDGGVYIYSKVNTSITIPTIAVFR